MGLQWGESWEISALLPKKLFFRSHGVCHASCTTPQCMEFNCGIRRTSSTIPWLLLLFLCARHPLESRGATMCVSSSFLPWQYPLPCLSISVNFDFWRRFCVRRPDPPVSNPEALGLGLAVADLPFRRFGSLATTGVILLLFSPLHLSYPFSSYAVHRRGHI